MLMPAAWVHVPIQVFTEVVFFFKNVWDWLY